MNFSQIKTLETLPAWNMEMHTKSKEMGLKPFSYWRLISLTPVRLLDKSDLIFNAEKITIREAKIHSIAFKCTKNLFSHNGICLDFSGGQIPLLSRKKYYLINTELTIDIFLPAW